jgi:hypothetical protein
MSLLTDTIQTGPHRYQPQPDLTPAQTVNQQNLARIVGYVTLGLPTLLILVGVFTETCLYISLSHFYYAPLWGTIFVGSLVFIGTYLLVWQGQNRAERRLANLAAPFAWGIAVFPTSRPGCNQEGWAARVFAQVSQTGETPVLTIPASPASYFQLSEWSNWIHQTCALIFFLILAYFALCVFTRIVPDQHVDVNGNLRPGKRRRNRVYRICGGLILTTILILWARQTYIDITQNDPAFWDDNNLTLYAEAVALYAFGYSWMVKGGFWHKRFCEA